MHRMPILFNFMNKKLLNVSETHLCHLTVVNNYSTELTEQFEPGPNCNYTFKVYMHIYHHYKT